MKDYYPPMHTAEHVLNRTMVNMFNCGRAFSAHLEKKKSKCDYHFSRNLSPDEIAQITTTVNNMLAQHLPVSELFLTVDEASGMVDLSKLPEHARQERIRVVKVGDYDICACIGEHVKNTSEVKGKFEIISTSYENSILRIRFKIKE